MHIDLSTARNHVITVEAIDNAAAATPNSSNESDERRECLVSRMVLQESKLVNEQTCQVIVIMVFGNRKLSLLLLLSGCQLSQIFLTLDTTDMRGPILP